VRMMRTSTVLKMMLALTLSWLMVVAPLWIVFPCDQAEHAVWTVGGYYRLWTFGFWSATGAYFLSMLILSVRLIVVLSEAEAERRRGGAWPDTPPDEAMRRQWEAARRLWIASVYRRRQFSLRALGGLTAVVALVCGVGVSVGWRALGEALLVVLGTFGGVCLLLSLLWVYGFLRV
jgi:hypothetical protein